MSMKTNVKKIGDTVVISVAGRLDYEIQEPFKKDMNRLITQVQTDITPRKIIFNLENLDFVGSSGITQFIQTLRDFNTQAPTKPRFCNVGSEFKRMMKVFDETEIFEIYESEDRARKSFDQ